MKEPGLDGRHRDADGRISQKHGNTKNANLSQPIKGLPENMTVDEMRKASGQESLKDIREFYDKNPPK
jgi:hypothetical protein